MAAKSAHRPAAASCKKAPPRPLAIVLPLAVALALASAAPLASWHDAPGPPLAAPPHAPLALPDGAAPEPPAWTMRQPLPPAYAHSTTTILPCDVTSGSYRVSSIDFTSPDRTYKLGESILIRVTATLAIDNGGSSGFTHALSHTRIALDVGTPNRYAVYKGHIVSGGEYIDYNYTVQAGDMSDGLDYNSTLAWYARVDSYRIIEVAFGSYNELNCAFPEPRGPGSLSDGRDVRVDGIVPRVQNVSAAVPNGTYAAGEEIRVNVTFSEAVRYPASAPPPTLTLDFDGPDRAAAYELGNNTDTLVFNYTVRHGDGDTARLGYNATNALAGIITDIAGNAANLTLPAPGEYGSLGNSSRIAIMTAPAVANVSSPNATRTYTEGDRITVRVAFTENVTVATPPGGGAPYVPLDVGRTVHAAPYLSGNGTAVLSFVYTVRAGASTMSLNNADAPISLNGSSIEDAAGNAAELALPDPGGGTSLAATTPGIGMASTPVVVRVSSNATGAHGPNAAINITVAFSGGVAVDTASGTPLLTLDTGVTGRNATYVSGSGTPLLVFKYVVVQGDESPDLNYTGASALLANGGSVTGTGNAAGLPADLGLPDPSGPNSLAGTSDIRVDTAAPLLVRVSSPGGSETYAVGEAVTVRVTFTENVTAGGAPAAGAPAGAAAPSLALNVSDSTRTAAYASGSGTDTLSFNYTVAAGDEAADLDYAGTGALEPGTGGIADDAGNAANTALPLPGTAGSLGALYDIVLDGAVPAVANVSSPNASRTYTEGDRITVRVAFTENVTVATPPGGGGGAPYVPLDVGRTVHAAPYSSGNGTDVLSFVYTVRAGASTMSLNNADAPISLNGSSIEDAAGNAAELALPDPGGGTSLAATTPGIGMASTPVVVRVSSNATGAHGPNAAINITVAFSGGVAVDTMSGTPLLTLDTGATARNATYVSGSGTPLLVFKYVVVQGDESPDLNYTGASALLANGGIVTGTGNAAGLPADLGLPDPSGPNSLAGTSDIRVDTAAPLLVRVSSPGGSETYAVGEAVTVRVTFTENVTAGGAAAGAPAAPSLALNVSDSTRTAAYASGSGTDTLSFNYTVAAGDEAADLDYAGTGALEPGSGGIADDAGNAANTALPLPGTAGSLGALYDIVLDGEAPRVAGVSSPNASGTYGAGDRIAVVVEMTRNVTVAGESEPPLYLYLNAGGGGGGAGTAAPYESGSGTARLLFSYTVADGDGTARLAYPNASALVLHGTGAAVTGLNGAAANLALPEPGADESLSGASAPALAVRTGGAPPPPPPPPPRPLAAASVLNASLTGPNTVTVHYNTSIGAPAAAYGSLTLAAGGARSVTGLAAGNNTAAHELEFDGPKAGSDDSGSMSIAAFSDGSARFAGDPAVDVLDGQPRPIVHSVASQNATNAAYAGSYRFNSSILISVVFSEDVYLSRPAAGGGGGGGTTPVDKLDAGAAGAALYIELNTGRNATLLPLQEGVAARSYNFTYGLEDGDDSDGVLDYLGPSSLRADMANASVNAVLGGGGGLGGEAGPRRGGHPDPAARGLARLAGPAGTLPCTRRRALQTCRCSRAATPPAPPLTLPPPSRAA